MASSPNNYEIAKSDQEWKKQLTPEQFEVLRKHGTERAFTSPLDKEYREGTFVCGACETPLFSSETKYDSGTGWPSFYAPIEGAIGTSVDRKLFMTRIEVPKSRTCRRARRMPPSTTPSLPTKSSPSTCRTWRQTSCLTCIETKTTACFSREMMRTGRAFDCATTRAPEWRTWVTTRGLPWIYAWV
jgi:peptide-methionine (R)-S-oxide reductase